MSLHCKMSFFCSRKKFGGIIEATWGIASGLVVCAESDISVYASVDTSPTFLTVDWWRASLSHCSAIS
jgi:hypothetical protein